MDFFQLYVKDRELQMLSNRNPNNRNKNKMYICKCFSGFNRFRKINFHSNFNFAK